MTAMSNYLENELIDHVLRNAAYSTPGTDVWVALYTNSQGESDSGTEASGGSYARVNATSWTAPSNGATDNSAAITFPQATANWGTINSVGIKDSCSGTGTDNLLLYGDLDSPKTVNNNDTFQFAIGDLDVTFA